MKVRAGKLAADIKEILNEMKAQGFELLEIGPPHLLALATLPMHHKNPFDHLLIAQAIAEGATFLSEDGYTPQYPVQYVICSARRPVHRSPEPRGRGRGTIQPCGRTRIPPPMSAASSSPAGR